LKNIWILKALFPIQNFILFQHSHDFSLTVSFIVENCDFMIKFMRINCVEINGHTYPFMTTEELNIFCWEKWSSWFIFICMSKVNCKMYVSRCVKFCWVPVILIFPLCKTASLVSQQPLCNCCTRRCLVQSTGKIPTIICDFLFLKWLLYGCVFMSKALTSIIMIFKDV